MKNWLNLSFFLLPLEWLDDVMHYEKGVTDATYRLYVAVPFFCDSFCQGFRIAAPY
jgi:hypothetical protein